MIQTSAPGAQTAAQTPSLVPPKLSHEPPSGRAVAETPGRAHAAAVGSLNKRSLGPLSDLFDDDPGAEHPLQPRPAPAPLPPPSLPPSVDPPPAPAPRDPITDRAPRCVRLVGMLFAPNKSFLLPEAMEGIRLLAHMYAEHPEAEPLVVGHTDTTGTASRNRSLSLARARSILQFVTEMMDRQKLEWPKVLLNQFRLPGALPGIIRRLIIDRGSFYKE